MVALSPIARVAVVGLPLLLCAIAPSCATDVHARSRPAQIAATSDGRTIRLLEGARPALTVGRLAQPLKAGGRWRAVGTVPEGTVYKPLDGILQVRTGHAYEALAVLHGEDFVGVFLPVEKAFLEAKTIARLHFEVLE